MSNSSRGRFGRRADGAGPPPLPPLAGRSRDSADWSPATFFAFQLFVSRLPGRPLERRCSSRTFRYGYLVTT